MSVNPTYSIDFHGLVTGKSYTYDFPIDDRFFERWPESEISRGQGVAHVVALRHASMMELDVVIDAQVEIVCDRCLEDFSLPIRFDGHPVVKITPEVPQGEEYREGADNHSDGDVLWISPADEALDMGQYIYESIILSLPFQRVHPDIKECNPDMLERFRIVSADEFDHLTTEAEAVVVNPFEKLAELKKDDE